MQVVLQDHVCEELQPAFLLEMPPRVEDDVSGFLPGEDRELTVDGGSHEVGILIFEELVPRACHGRKLLVFISAIS